MGVESLGRSRSLDVLVNVLRGKLRLQNLERVKSPTPQAGANSWGFII